MRATRSALHRPWVRTVASVVSILVAISLVAALPYIVGIDWGVIWAQFARLNPWIVVGLFALWGLGLWAYTWVLTASLPGLNHRQALTLNAVGSAVSNLMPFGGAAGVAVNFAMARSWGFRSHAVAVSTVASGICNVLARFLLPAVGLVALLAAGHVPDSWLAVPVGTASVGLFGLVAVLVVALRWDRAADVVGRAADRALRVLPHRIRPAEHQASAALARLRVTTSGLLRTSWLPMTLGMSAYLALQAALFCACLLATGAYLGVGEAVAAFALGRLLTTVVVTPGGFGIAEAGTAAVMIHLGGAPGPVTAAVLLFSMFTFVLEVPLGAVFWLLRSLSGSPARRDRLRLVPALTMPSAGDGRRTQDTESAEDADGVKGTSRAAHADRADHADHADHADRVSRRSAAEY
jgi:uncharacterized membrane protein YbhN (UPF0104 family)